jgi:hypothetical protein
LVTTADAKAIRVFARVIAPDVPKRDILAVLLGKLDSSMADRKAAIWKVLQYPENQDPAALSAILHR